MSDDAPSLTWQASHPDEEGMIPSMPCLAAAERFRQVALDIERRNPDSAHFIRLAHKRAELEEYTGWIDALRWAADYAELSATD